MKVVQIIDRLHLAGGQTMCGNLTLELQKFGCDVVVVSFYSLRSSITEMLEQNGVQIVFLNKKSGVDFSVIRKVKKVIKEEKPDVIHTHLGTFIYCACAMLGQKKIRWVHTVHSMAQREAAGIRGIIARIFFRNHKAIPVALSSVVQNSIAEKYNISHDEIPVVFNGIDLNKCIPKNDYSVPGKFKIVHIGRFSKVKNHLGLIQSFDMFHCKYPNSELFLIGDGELCCEMKDYVKEIGLSNAVIFCGLQDDVYPFLNQADIFVLPSFVEGIPMTIIEAIGTGVPIVATAVGGVPDMLENGVNALFCEVDKEQIAECFEKYYLDEKLRVRFGKAALERSKAFSAEEMGRKYLAIYKGMKLG